MTPEPDNWDECWLENGSYWFFYRWDTRDNSGKWSISWLLTTRVEQRPRGVHPRIPSNNCPRGTLMYETMQERDQSWERIIADPIPTITLLALQ